MGLEGSRFSGHSRAAKGEGSFLRFTRPFFSRLASNRMPLERSFYFIYYRLVIYYYRIYCSQIVRVFLRPKPSLPQERVPFSLASVPDRLSRLLASRFLVFFQGSAGFSQQQSSGTIISFLGLSKGSETDFSILLLLWWLRLAIILAVSFFREVWARICCLLFLYCCRMAAISLSSLIWFNFLRSLSSICLSSLNSLSLAQAYRLLTLRLWSIEYFFAVLSIFYSAYSYSTLSPSTQSSQFSPSFPYSSSLSPPSPFSSSLTVTFSDYMLIFCSLTETGGTSLLTMLVRLELKGWTWGSFLASKSCAMLSVLWWSQSYLLCFIVQSYQELMWEVDLSVERLPLVNSCFFWKSLSSSEGARSYLQTVLPLVLGSRAIGLGRTGSILAKDLRLSVGPQEIMCFPANKFIIPVQYNKIMNHLRHPVDALRCFLSLKLVLRMRIFLFWRLSYPCRISFFFSSLMCLISSARIFTSFSPKFIYSLSQQLRYSLMGVFQQLKTGLKGLCVLGGGEQGRGFLFFLESSYCTLGFFSGEGYSKMQGIAILQRGGFYLKTRSLMYSSSWFSVGGEERGSSAEGDLIIQNNFLLILERIIGRKQKMIRSGQPSA